MKLSKSNLSLYRIASTDKSRTGLTGVHVDPKRVVTAASNGAMLVEISATASEATLAEPIILPAKAAQQAAKEVAEGKHALITEQDGKYVLMIDGKKIPFEPVDATYPDYAKSDLFSGKGEGKRLTFNAEYLRHMLAAVGIAKLVSVTMYGDRLRVEAKSDEGQTARGVLMCCGGPTQPANTEQRSKEEPQPSGGKRFRWWGKKAASTSPKQPALPSDKQRMFYTYLLRRTGKKITPAILSDNEIAAKIEALKQDLKPNLEFATWPQWKKINYLLLDQKAEPEAVSEVLNAIRDVKTASDAISAWNRNTTGVAA